MIKFIRRKWILFKIKRAAKKLEKDYPEAVMFTGIMDEHGNTTNFNAHYKSGRTLDEERIE